MHTFSAFSKTTFFANFCRNCSTAQPEICRFHFCDFWQFLRQCANFLHKVAQLRFLRSKFIKTFNICPSIKPSFSFKTSFFIFLSIYISIYLYIYIYIYIYRPLPRSINDQKTTKLPVGRKIKNEQNSQPVTANGTKCGLHYF